MCANVVSTQSLLAHHRLTCLVGSGTVGGQVNRPPSMLPGLCQQVGPQCRGYQGIVQVCGKTADLFNYGKLCVNRIAFTDP